MSEGLLGGASARPSERASPVRVLRAFSLPLLFVLRFSLAGGALYLWPVAGRGLHRFPVLPVTAGVKYRALRLPVGRQALLLTCRVHVGSALRRCGGESSHPHAHARTQLGKRQTAPKQNQEGGEGKSIQVPLALTCARTREPGSHVLFSLSFETVVLWFCGSYFAFNATVLDSLVL